jgi:hypothetical protein
VAGPRTARAPGIVLRLLFEQADQTALEVDELIAAVGLTEHANKRIRMLSGGQRRRLDVAIGLVGKLVTVSGTILAHLVILLIPGAFIVRGLDVTSAGSWLSAAVTRACHGCG